MKAFLTLVLLSTTLVALAKADRDGDGPRGRFFGRRRGGGGGRGGFIDRPFGGSADFFEATGPEDDCSNVPSSSTPATSTTSTTSPQRGSETSGKFFSLSGINVCDNASVGDQKCICIRGRFFNRGYKLKCGTCEMTFKPDRNRSSDLRDANAIIELDEEEDEFGGRRDEHDDNRDDERDREEERDDREESNDKGSAFERK